MKKYKAIPPGYMTVGELAKKMGTTVRTLQYYDKEGVLTPSAESEGGRRLYTDKDIIKLHQIQSMKYLGLSLDDIKNRLVLLDTPTDVAAMLKEHAAAVREKIKDLSESLSAIEALTEEVLQMQSVNLKKYADIVVNLRIKNEMYPLIKHIDDTMLDRFRNRFDMESGMAMKNKMFRLFSEAIQYLDDGVLPESEQGQAFAKDFWDTIMEFTEGDMSVLTSLIGISDNLDSANDEWAKKQEKANTFIESALDVYFTNLGINPLEEVEND